MPRRVAYCRLGWKPTEPLASTVHRTDGLLAVQLAGAWFSGSTNCSPIEAARPTRHQRHTHDQRAVGGPSMCGGAWFMGCCLRAERVRHANSAPERRRKGANDARVDAAATNGSRR